MKKFELVNLEDLPKGARFYFPLDHRKRVYEILESVTGDPFTVLIRIVGTDLRMKHKTYKRTTAGKVTNQPKEQCVFLSLAQ